MAETFFHGKKIEQVNLPTGTSVSTSGRVATLATPVALDGASTLVLGVGGITFPTSDPLIAGAWWDSAGTLTKSTGP